MSEWDSSRLSVAQHVLKTGSLVGDEVAVKVVLEESLFEESLKAGKVDLVLVAKSGEEVCPRNKLVGSERVRVVKFSTCMAKKFDVSVRFALLESNEPVLFSQVGLWLLLSFF
jgi:hypothetical protein